MKNNIILLPFFLLTACGEAPVTASAVDDEFYDQLVEKYHEAQRPKPNYRDAEDVINSALMEFYYGGNGTTKSEELLQLPSSIN